MAATRIRSIAVLEDHVSPKAKAKIAELVDDGLDYELAFILVEELFSEEDFYVVE